MLQAENMKILRNSQAQLKFHVSYKKKNFYIVLHQTVTTHTCIYNTTSFWTNFHIFQCPLEPSSYTTPLELVQILLMDVDQK